jgi:hypothetical protein
MACSSTSRCSSPSSFDSSHEETRAGRAR